jgi:hypothetical protein
MAAKVRKLEDELEKLMFPEYRDENGKDLEREAGGHW